VTAHRSIKPGSGKGRHAPQLIAGNRSGSTELEPLNQLVGRLRRGLKMGLEPILHVLPEVTMQDAAIMRYDEYMADVLTLASNSLFRVKRTDARFLLSVDGKAIMRLVDRYFGGTGDQDITLPHEFPMSSELMIERLETMIVASMAEAIDSASPVEIEREKHEAVIEHLAYLEPSDEIVLSRMIVNESGREPWHIDFVFAGSALRLLAPDLPHRVTSRRPNRANWDDFVQSSMGCVPLPIRAVMAENSIPMALIADLAPGHVLPLTLSRMVSLRVGEQIIGQGTLGQQDDQMAIQIKQILND
jgi:flagellar motor switch protein FliM